MKFEEEMRVTRYYSSLEMEAILGSFYDRLASMTTDHEAIYHEAHFSISYVMICAQMMHRLNCHQTRDFHLILILTWFLTWTGCLEFSIYVRIDAWDGFFYDGSAGIAQDSSHRTLSFMSVVIAVEENIGYPDLEPITLHKLQRGARRPWSFVRSSSVRTHARDCRTCLLEEFTYDWGIFSLAL